MSKHHTKVRFLHNVAPIGSLDSINLFLDDESLVKNLSYNEMTEYLSVPACNFLLTAKSFNDKTVIIFSQLLNLKKGCRYTIILEGSFENCKLIKAYRYKDDDVCPRPGYAVIRFINASYENSNITENVWLGDHKIFENVAFGKAGTPYYKLVPAAKYSLKVTNFDGGATIVRPLDFDIVSGGIYTLMTTGDNGIIRSHDNKGKCVKLQHNYKSQEADGRWFVISSIAPHATNCTRVVVDSTLLEGYTKLAISSYDKDGKRVADQGVFTAYLTVPDKTQPAALYVSFKMPEGCSLVSLQLPFDEYEPGYCPEEPNILIHETDYCKYMIVGTPDHTQLYILSRKPTLSKCAYETLVHKVKCLGYDVDNLIIDGGAVRV